MRRTIIVIPVLIFLTAFYVVVLLDFKSETRKIVVPNDYSTIQAAIDNASDGDEILVKNGTYHENLIIDKAISLTGEDNNSTVIQGNGNATILVRHDSVDIKGFNIQGSLEMLVYDYGVHLLSVKNCNIFDNRVENAYTGVWLFDSSFNNVFENKIAESWSEGIYLDASCNNVFAKNSIVGNNYWGIRIKNAHNNTIYHNNFIDNRISHVWYSNSVVDTNQFDSENQGNYWSDYNGIDVNGNGIGDTPYVINANNQDSYPLMALFDIEKTSKYSVPFPTTFVIAVVIIVIVVSLGLLIYFKKRRVKSGE